MITLFHAPKTRSFTALWFLEELGEPYTIQSLDMSKNEHQSPQFLARNPMGKVPAVDVDGVFVSERPAILIYLADLYPQKSLAPRPTEATRGEYLRWMVFAAASVEPAFMEKFKGWEVDPRQAAWGNYARVVETMEKGLAGKSFILGDRFSAADVMLGSMVHFGLAFGLLQGETFASYLKRLQARPAMQAALAKDAG